jgi:hypothetical protein
LNNPFRYTFTHIQAGTPEKTLLILWERQR